VHKASAERGHEYEICEDLGPPRSSRNHRIITHDHSPAREPAYSQIRMNYVQVLRLQFGTQKGRLCHVYDALRLIRLNAFLGQFVGG
jgi:hypothetical protein